MCRRLGFFVSGILLRGFVVVYVWFRGCCGLNGFPICCWGEAASLIRSHVPMYHPCARIILKKKKKSRTPLPTQR